MPAVKKRFLIAGAGITGLSVAYYLLKRFGNTIDLQIWEKSSRAGGWITTSHAEDFLFEHGPRSCRTKGNGFYTLKLIEELGLQNQVILPEREAKARFIYQENGLLQLPESPFSLIKPPFLRWFLSAINKDWKAKIPCEEESIQQFAERHFGEEIANQLFDAMTSGIYAGDISKLSMAACFPRLYEMSLSHGSLLKGWLLGSKKKQQPLSSFMQTISKAPFFSFQEGMGTLPKVLEQSLSKQIIYNKELSTFPPEVDHLIWTAPLQPLKTCLPEKSNLKNLLQAIPYASLAVVNVGYQGLRLNKKGFGYLVPSSAKQAILGTVWDSAVFPQQNIGEQTRLTVMIGGTRFQDFNLKSPEDFKKIALKSLCDHLGITAKPAYLSCLIAKQAIPQYQIGHLGNVAQIKSEAAKFPGLHLLSTGLEGVAVNDCVAKAYQFAQNIQI